MTEPTGDRSESSATRRKENRSPGGGVAGNGGPGAGDCHERLHQVVQVFHNEVGSPLAAIGLRFEMLRRRLHSDPSADAEFGELSRELDKVVDSVRRALKELRALEAAAGQR